jgi:hypothetical protein
LEEKKVYVTVRVVGIGVCSTGKMIAILKCWLLETQAESPLLLVFRCASQVMFPSRKPLEPCSDRGQGVGAEDLSSKCLSSLRFFAGVHGDPRAVNITRRRRGNMKVLVEKEDK